MRCGSPHSENRAVRAVLGCVRHSITGGDDAKYLRFLFGTGVQSGKGLDKDAATCASPNKPTPHNMSSRIQKAAATKQALEQLARLAHKRRALRAATAARPAMPSGPSPPPSRARNAQAADASVSLASRKQYWNFWKELLELEWA